MSLSSINYISAKNKIKNIYWVIEHLGYREIVLDKELKKYYRKCYFWQPQDVDLTYVGIELYVSNNDNNKIKIETRTRAGRSFVELAYQNLTIKTINNFFGGSFETDYGKNKYFSSTECSPEKSSIAMALYVQRWKLKNALVPIHIYSDFVKKALQQDEKVGNLYGRELIGISYLDMLRPCVVSCNIQLPYVIGAWENYIKNSFLVILKYTNIENKIIKPERLSAEDLDKIRIGKQTIEECITNKMSFQRPQCIIDNFNKLDRSIDVNSIFVRPYKKRKTTLKESIDKIITLRNKIVHDGVIDEKLTFKDVERFVNDIVEAADRFYKLFAKKYKFEPNFDF